MAELTVDSFTPEQRSRIMAANKCRNTKPELATRRLLHSMGFRFRLHRKDLPGCPDIVLPRHHCVIFVNGCFWHQHENCSLATKPATRPDFWRAKFDRNVNRDRENYAKLVVLGWHVIVVWECELRDLVTLKQQLASNLAQRNSKT